jgi:hypothetical protein
VLSVVSFTMLSSNICGTGVDACTVKLYLRAQPYGPVGHRGFSLTQ